MIFWSVQAYRRGLSVIFFQSLYTRRKVNEDNAMHSFKEGDVVRAEFPAIQGKFNVAPHYLVVLGVAPKGVLTMFTTSLKDRSGGVHQFSSHEMVKAGFAKPCRFDPGRLALYLTQDLQHLQATGRTVSKTTVQRMIQAAQDVKAKFVIFTPSERYQAKVA